MKRILGLVLALASIGVVGLTSEAKANDLSANTITMAAAATPQWRRDRNRRINNRVRTATRTRVIRLGRRLYRETYVVRYLPNGRVVDTRVISRVRIS